MTELEQDPLAGHGKYRAVRALGQGGMGEVFEAEHQGLGTRVVIKLLHAELADKPHLLDRMRIEAQALARLRHPNLVRVTDFDVTPAGRPFFVMEYLDGRNVKDEAEQRGGALPAGEALEIVRQALAGLAVAHEAGLVHRDVKLDNLFLVDPPASASTASEPLAGRTVKVLDFGVAKVLHAGEQAPAPLAVPTDSGVVVGTPRFFAPEQARGKPLDHRADIYSMGLVLYSLLAGRGPFDHATSVSEMARAHAFDLPEPPSHFAAQALSPRLDALVLRCLAKDPEERFPSAAELAVELDRVAAAVAPAAGARRAHGAAPQPATMVLGAEPGPVEDEALAMAETAALDPAGIEPEAPIPGPAVAPTALLPEEVPAPNQPVPKESPPEGAAPEPPGMTWERMGRCRPGQPHPSAGAPVAALAVVVVVALIAGIAIAAALSRLL